MSDYEWRRSSYCASGACVLVGLNDDGMVLVRDSKRDDLAVLEFTRFEWALILAEVRGDAPRVGRVQHFVDGKTVCLTDSQIRHMHATAEEWDAFVAGVHNGEFDYDKLSSGDEAGSGFRGVARSGQAATGAGAIAVPPAPVAANPCTCPPPTAGGIVGVNRGHLLGCPELAGDVAAPVAADPTIGEALCADGIHEADGPCCSTGAAALVPGSSRRAPEPDLLLDDAKPWLNPCGRCDYGMPMDCTCPEGDPRPVMVRLAAEIERLRNAQGWDPSSPQHAVIRAAIAWRKAVDDLDADEAVTENALIEAVDELPHIGDLWDAIRGALTPVPDVEPEPAWGSGPLVEHVTETPGTGSADPDGGQR